MNFESIPDYILAAVGLAGLWYGLLQYRADRKWKRLEFAAEVMNKIKDDFDIRLAIDFLNWSDRDTYYPDRYVINEVQKNSFKHTTKFMASAFDMDNRVRIPGTNYYDLKELSIERMIYVDVFERLFQYLEDVNAFIESGLVEWKNVETLWWWANHLCELQINGKPVFLGYLKAYDYDGIIRLGNRLKSDSKNS